MTIPFDNTYFRDLRGFYAPGTPEPKPAPELVVLNTALAEELGLDEEALRSTEGVAVLAAAAVPQGADVLAQAYAGHQFGNFVPQLGDGRALLIGEVVDRKGRRRDLQWKGSGRTVFSRGGDGKAGLGPVLREYILGETMQALGIPTTRALAAATTGERVYRERPLPGAVLTRVAASHIRVGTFQFFAARGDTEKLRTLTLYTLRRHYPEAPEEPLALLDAVIAAQAKLIAQWMLVGFIHGVMNTDNMALSGETIDYGPCAFVEHYSAGAVFSSIDQMGRYAYGNQPGIARWNLSRFAETLLPLLVQDPEDQAQVDRAVAQATERLQAFAEQYDAHWLRGMRAKLGLQTEEPGDRALAEGLLTWLDGRKRDFTMTFRRLRDVPGPWGEEWRARLAREGATPESRQAAMDAVNPLYIARNHQVERALAAAAEGDLAPLHGLLEAVADPFTERAGLEEYAMPAPDGGVGYRTFCGT